LPKNLVLDIIETNKSPKRVNYGGGSWELIDGIPVSMAPTPMKIHQKIASELFFN